MIRVRHQDDRGKPVRLRPLGHRGTEPGSWKRFAIQARESFHQAKGWAAVASGSALVGVVLAVWLMTRDVVTLFFFSPVGSTFVVIVAVLVLSIGRLWSAWPHWVRETHLDADRCPVCGYHLKGLLEDPDGCVGCPECNAAWNTGEIKATVGDRPIVVVAEELRRRDHSDEYSAPPMKTLDRADEPNS